MQQQAKLSKNTKSWNISTLKKLNFLRYFEPYEKTLRHKLTNYDGFDSHPEFKRKQGFCKDYVGLPIDQEDMLQGKTA